MTILCTATQNGLEVASREVASLEQARQILAAWIFAASSSPQIVQLSLHNSAGIELERVKLITQAKPSDPSVLLIQMERKSQ